MIDCISFMTFDKLWLAFGGELVFVSVVFRGFDLPKGWLDSFAILDGLRYP